MAIRLSNPSRNAEERGLRKWERLTELSKQYDVPWVEYSEGISAPGELLWLLDLEQLKSEGWFPRSIDHGVATIIAREPGPALEADIKHVLGVESVQFLVTLPGDLLRIIEHNQDVNPRFPAMAGRTPLAKVRTYLAGRRSLYAHYRTLFAKSRTGLAFIRTGLSFITIAFLFLRVFGGRLFLLLEVPLLLSGLLMVLDGLKWYLPARKIHASLPGCAGTEPSGGSSVLEVENEDGTPRFSRSGEVDGAVELRGGWSSLSPVMRRRFLASDRTDLAEERTVLACYRTRMAKARTGLAFTRTGIAFLSLGLALFRHFGTSYWQVFDLGLVLVGGLMAAEGFLWYFSGRRAGVEGLASVEQRSAMTSIWDFFFPHRHASPRMAKGPGKLPVKSSQAPGIWATTGVALERTVLAERRNVMARLRTMMARARTGFAFIRTGLAISLVGIGFLVYFGDGIGWYLTGGVMLAAGTFLVIDGFVWSVPAERLRQQFPYCYGEMEISIPNYGEPCRSWNKVVFSNEEY